MSGSSGRAAASGQTTDAPYLHRVQDVRFRPVFIMGSARSGTTILYRLLTMTGRFNWVSAYHLISYGGLLAHHQAGTTAQAKEELSERFRRLGIGGARFDGVAISPDFPEEYGFGIADGSRMQITPRTWARFLELCRKVQYISAPGRPLLLKNPWDSRAFLDLKQRLPESRFIFIHRNPAAVVRSLLEGMRELLRERNEYHALLADFYDRLMESQPLRLRATRLLFSPRLGLGARLVGWQVARTARYFVDHVGALAPEDYISLRYEDLCADPDRVVHQVLGFLGEEENHGVRYRDFIQASRPRRGGDDGEAAAVLRRRELQPYLAYCGYQAD
jgi:hypothetical protein